jgi:hypothetical protein
MLTETIEQYNAPGTSMTLTAGTKAFVLTKPDVGIFGCSMEDGRVLRHQRAFVPRGIPVSVNGRIYILTRGLVPTVKDLARFICFDELTGERIYETEHKELLAYRPSPPQFTRVMPS